MLQNHPDRACINQELHLRRMPAIAAPARVIQILRTIANIEPAAEQDYLAQLPEPTLSRQCGARHCQIELAGGRALVWERHSEASTLTLICPQAARATFDLKTEPLLGWLEAAPGEVLRATAIVLTMTDDSAAAMLPAVGFDPEELLSAGVGGGARIWSDFKLHPDGYGRLLVSANALPAADCGRLIQTLQEMGNYRNLALLGLLSAQREAGALRALEEQLLQVSVDLNRTADESALLDRLVTLAVATSALAAKTGYRMSATRAYSDIAVRRLHALDASAIPGFQSLEDFIERRLLPGARTCEAFDRRLERLAERIERATAQLQTRLEHDIQNQNSAMLASMEASAAQQVQLQRMVEGLSFVALSYYSVGLFGYLAKAAAHRWPAVDSAALTGWMVIPITVGVAMMLHSRVRQKHKDPVQRPAAGR